MQISTQILMQIFNAKAQRRKERILKYRLQTCIKIFEQELFLLLPAIFASLRLCFFALKFALNR